MEKVCILLADDHALFRSGMKYLLANLDGDVQVIEGANYTDAVNIAEQNKDLSIALVDLSMPGFDNFSGLPDPSTKINFREFPFRTSDIAT